MTDRQAYEVLRERGAAAETVESVLDLARLLSSRSGDLAPLLRALTVAPVHLRRQSVDGPVVTATDGHLRCVCAWSSPVRLLSTMRFEDEQVTVQAVMLDELARGLAADEALLLDAWTEAAVLLEPVHLREVRALAAGLPTAAALRAVEGEVLLSAPGPPTRTALDQQVLGEVPQARRALVRLDGVGGRDWPLYVVDDEPSRRRLIDRLGPGVLLVGADGELQGLEPAVACALPLADLPRLSEEAGGAQ